MPSEAVIIRYLKVKALAEQGIPGERDNAKGILARMEAEHPQLRQAAEAYRRQHEEPEPEPAPPPRRPSSTKRRPVEPNESSFAGFGGFGSFDGAPSGPAGPGSWENIFKYAQSGFSAAYGFAESVANALAGRELAGETTFTTKSTTSGCVTVTMKMTLAIYQQALGLNALQKAAFRQALHERLDEQLDRLLGRP